ncbi:hypothetical protein ACIRPT_05855 [Streptomyces sp. NPDC101227]|uniref:hypothetical protein n=1 Tax=Streptomyces sp. NPDC101227 TaxID=3366136 RepID=UPI0037FDB21C
MYMIMSGSIRGDFVRGGDGTLLRASAGAAGPSGDPAPSRSSDPPFCTRHRKRDHEPPLVERLKRYAGTPNATMAGKLQLESLQAAVAKATANGMELNKRMTVGGWQLEFRKGTGDELPVLIHARQIDRLRQ